MANPYHDPENGQFAEGPGGDGDGAKTGDKTTDRALARKAAAEKKMQDRIDRAMKDMQARRAFTKGRSAG